MKNISIKWVYPAVMTLLFISVQACNQTDKNKGQVQTDQQDVVYGYKAQDNKEAHDHQNLTDHSLVLNDGAKWAADEPTGRNAKIINSIGNQFLANEKRTLEDYQAFGFDVNEAINTMIRECTMEGEADQALHFWFAPILQHANTLKNATDTTGLSEITLDMVDRMRIYNDYFAQK